MSPSQTLFWNACRPFHGGTDQRRPLEASGELDTKETQSCSLVADQSVATLAVERRGGDTGREGQRSENACVGRVARVATVERDGQIKR